MTAICHLYLSDQSSAGSWTEVVTCAETVVWTPVSGHNYCYIGGQLSQDPDTMMRYKLLFLMRLGLSLARMDTLSPTDYLTISVDCRDDRIKVT